MLLPRLVRLVSAKQSLVATLPSLVFSRRHFPKTLATASLLAFGVGFGGMHKWQQRRQWKWEQRQREAEDYYFEKNYNSTQTQQYSVL